MRFIQKSTTKIIKKLFLILSIIAGILFIGCEKTETEISGDSSLKIINNCNFTVSIYFDDDFIGKVDKEANRTWSVPSGNHEVRASSSFASDVTENPTFIAGNTIVITLSTGAKSSTNGEIYMDIL